MRYLLFLLTLTLGSTPVLQAQTVERVQQFGGPGDDAVVAVSSWSGQTCVAGSFSEQVDFGGVVLTSMGGIDGFLACYNDAGSLIWARRVGSGLGSGRAIHAALSNDGTVWVTGSFSDLASFDGGTQASVSLTSAGGVDAFVARYSASGDLIWALDVGGPEDDDARHLALRGSQSAVVVGRFEGTASFGTHTLASAGEGDAFIAAVQAEGTVVWAARGGGTQEDSATTVALVSGGDVLIGGTFSGVAVFPPFGIQSEGEGDGFLARYNPSGQPSWARPFGGVGEDRIEALAVSNATLFVAGTFTQTLSVGSDVLISSGSTDIFLAALSLEGIPVWGRRCGSPTSDQSGGLSVAGSEIALVGSTGENATLGERPLPSHGASDILLALFRDDGSLEFVDTFGGSESEEGRAVAHRLAAPSGGLVLGGIYDGPFDFGGIPVTSAGGTDGLLVTLLPPTPEVVFVRADAPPGGTGRTWASAYSDLTQALDDPASSLREIWVAEGTYTSTPYVLRDSVTLYGGFTGIETTLDARDPEANPTILTGESARRVLVAANVHGTRIDGFVLRDGRSTSLGGGLYALNSTLDIDRCRITSNTVSGSVGGGLALDGGRVVISRTMIEDNLAYGPFLGQASGGGLFAQNTDLRISNSSIANNASDSSPKGSAGVAGMRVVGGQVLVRDSEIRGNVGSGDLGGSGGVDLEGGATAVFIGVRFANNYGDTGGAITSYQSALVVLNSRFDTNRSWLFPGGAVRADSALIANSTFARNHSSGATAIYGANLDLINLTLFDHSSLSDAHVVLASEPTVRIRNSIFWNESPELGGPVDAAYSIIRGGFAGTAILDSDPQLDEDGRPQSGSPAIDFGINNFLPPDTFDLDGDGDTIEPIPFDTAEQPRIAGPGVDLGAYEYQGMVEAVDPQTIHPPLILEGVIPNPSRDVARLHFGVGRSATLVIDLFDLLGRRVLQLTHRALPGTSQSLSLPIEHLTPGVYVLRLTDEATGLSVSTRLTRLR